MRAHNFPAGGKRRKKGEDGNSSRNVVGKKKTQPSSSSLSHSYFGKRKLGTNEGWGKSTEKESGSHGEERRDGNEGGNIREIRQARRRDNGWVGRGGLVSRSLLLCVGLHSYSRWGFGWREARICPRGEGEGEGGRGDRWENTREERAEGKESQSFSLSL